EPRWRDSREILLGGRHVVLTHARGRQDRLADLLLILRRSLCTEIKHRCLIRSLGQRSHRLNRNEFPSPLAVFNYPGDPEGMVENADAVTHLLPRRSEVVHDDVVRPLECPARDIREWQKVIEGLVVNAVDAVERAA